MNRATRLIAVLDLLAETGAADVEDLVTKFGVSAATARRDLDTLASQQLVTRTHGGAIGQSMVAYDLPIRYKQELHAQEKLRIAQAASALVKRGDVIGLGGGTTSTAVANVLSARSDLMDSSPTPNLTVVTNAINIAAQLVMRPQIKTVVTGGVVHARSYELVGPYSDVVLEKITMDPLSMKASNKATAHLFIASPLHDTSGKPKGFMAGLFDTHPDPAVRIAKLREMAM